MALLRKRAFSFVATLGLLASLPLFAGGCGGGGGSDSPDERFIQTNPPAAPTATPPAIRVTPRVISIFSQANPMSRAAVDVLGGLVTAPQAAQPADAPVLRTIENTAVIATGGLVEVHFTWSDLGSDVNAVAFELLCQASTSTPRVHTVFTAAELSGASSGDSTFALQIDPTAEDAGYELHMALRDAQGNTGALIRSAFVVTKQASNPAFAAATAALIATGGEDAPILAPGQTWHPTGGNVDDTVPNGGEGALPANVAGDVPLIIQQPAVNTIYLIDSTFGTRRGVLFGRGVNFTYLFCYSGQPVDSDCAGAYATIGIGEVRDEFRLGRIDKRLYVQEVRVFLGSFNPASATPTLTDPNGNLPPECPQNAFPFALASESVVYTR